MQYVPGRRGGTAALSALTAPDGGTKLAVSFTMWKQTTAPSRVGVTESLRVMQSRWQVLADSVCASKRPEAACR